jgi:lysophospholipase L1-like esterase
LLYAPPSGRGILVLKLKNYLLLSASLNLLSCTHHYQKLAPHAVVIVEVGDSITFGECNSEGTTPGDYAARALDADVHSIRLGFRGESAAHFYKLHRGQLLDSLATIPPGHHIVLTLWYGANDLTAVSKEVTLANIWKVATWAHEVAEVPQVVIVPIMNRTDKFTRTWESDGSWSNHFNESRLWVNAELHRQVGAYPWARVASEPAAPAMYAEDFPADSVRCADGVHPLDAGAKEVGEGTIAHGIASFGHLRLKSN